MRSQANVIQAPARSIEVMSDTSWTRTAEENLTRRRGVKTGNILGRKARSVDCCDRRRQNTVERSPESDTWRAGQRPGFWTPPTPTDAERCPFVSPSPPDRPTACRTSECRRSGSPSLRRRTSRLRDEADIWCTGSLSISILPHRCRRYSLSASPICKTHRRENWIDARCELHYFFKKLRVTNLLRVSVADFCMSFSLMTTSAVFFANAMKRFSPIRYCIIPKTMLTTALCWRKWCSIDRDRHAK